MHSTVTDDTMHSSDDAIHLRDLIAVNDLILKHVHINLIVLPVASLASVLYVNRINGNQHPVDA